MVLVLSSTACGAEQMEVALVLDGSQIPDRCVLDVSSLDDPSRDESSLAPLFSESGTLTVLEPAGRYVFAAECPDGSRFESDEVDISEPTTVILTYQGSGN